MANKILISLWKMSKYCTHFIVDATAHHIINTLHLDLLAEIDKLLPKFMWVTSL